jgi:hypothetical protein
MKEYLVHIEIEDKDQLHTLKFHSSTLTVLFLAIDDFRKAISNVHVADTSMMHDTQGILESLSENFQRQKTVVEEQDQSDEDDKDLSTMENIKIKDNEDDELQEENSLAYRPTQEPSYKTTIPGAK